VSVGGTLAGGLAAAQSSPAQTPKAVLPAVSKSTVPKPLTRAETAAEDVIGLLEKGNPAGSRSEARILRELAYGQASGALIRAGASEQQIRTFQQRADRTARLASTGARPVATSLAANSVSELMSGFYARFQDPVPAEVLKLDYLDREIQLRSQSGERRRHARRWVSSPRRGGSSGFRS